MEQYEARINQYHSDLQLSYLNDIKSKLTTFIEAQLHYNLKALETYNSLYAEIDDIDVEKELKI